MVHGCSSDSGSNPMRSATALHALERQVALASLDPSHVSPVHAEHIGKRLLAETAGLPVSAKVAADGLLKGALHGENGPAPLLDSLQTHK